MSWKWNLGFPDWKGRVEGVPPGSAKLSELKNVQLTFVHVSRSSAVRSPTLVGSSPFRRRSRTS